MLGPVNITYYATGISEHALSIPDIADQYVGLDVLLDAVDGSFCTQADRSAGLQCGTTSLSTVLSVSYEYPEFVNSAAALRRVCNEFMKLSLQGHTIVVASGDYGLSFGTSNCTENSCLSRNATQDSAGDFLLQGAGTNGPIFNPGFPASCPYVLAVGATQLDANKTVFDPNPESAMYQPSLSTCPGVTTFSSSGGFSNIFSRPEYQNSTVAAYFAAHDPGYPYYSLVDSTDFGADGGVYNRIGRAFPDISANGVNFSTVVRGEDTHAHGTSRTSPADLSRCGTG